MAANLISKATGLSLSYVMNTEKKYKENPQPAMIVRELTIAPSNENTSAFF